MKFTCATRYKVTPLCASGDGTTITHFGIWDHVERRYWPNGARRWIPGLSAFTDPGVTLFDNRIDAHQALEDLKSH